MEWFKGLADTVNADSFEPDAATKLGSAELERLRELGREIGRITFFDSLVVVEKLTREKRQPYRRIITGRKAHVVDDPIAPITLAPNLLRTFLLTPPAAGAFTPELLDKLASAREEVGQLRAAPASRRGSSAARRVGSPGSEKVGDPEAARQKRRRVEPAR
jgi:hypothetical protein